MSEPKAEYTASVPDIYSEDNSMKAQEDENNQLSQLEDEESSVGSITREELPQNELDKLYRSLDYRIIPALWCLYFLTSFGSSAYGNTLTMNKAQGHSLSQTLNLTVHDKATASALYYVGYIIFDVPMNLVMTRLSPQIWLSRIVISVGLVYSCYAALHNGSGIMAIRFISGMCGAGTWPGMSYYISLWYPEHRTAKRIGYYFTAAQLSASAAGLVSAGFQKMDMTHGLQGWKWMFIVYGVITVFVGLTLIWWLPDRPAHLVETDKMYKSKMDKLVPGFIQKYTTATQPLSKYQRDLHKKDMEGRYKNLNYGYRDIIEILSEVRIWPLIIMYFGVVGTGFGLAVFGTTLIMANNPSLSGIDVSLLYAPIWLFDLGGILVVTPFADRFKKYRPLFFSASTVIIIVGMVVTTYAHGSWNRYGGLLIAGFGLGPTVPICMTMSAETFYSLYGDVGVAVSAALVSGLGNLGSVTATYALYSGWPADAARLYEYSNMMLVLMLGVSIVAAGFAVICNRAYGDKKMNLLNHYGRK